MGVEALVERFRAPLLGVQSFFSPADVSEGHLHSVGRVGGF